MSIANYRAAALFAAASVYIAAAEPVTPVAPGSLTAGPGLSSFLQVFLALGLVIAAIFLAAWLMRRLSPGHFAGAAQLRVVGGVMVGQKERVVVVELADTWLVLGVTSAQVSTLHTLAKPEKADITSVQTNPFAERLAAALRLRKSSDEAGAHATPVDAP
ncbi:flagellar protein FliO/FliZ [Chitinimonas taiwanensis DSM 18899]|uniref:Flagellar protein n=2 Tax=Chitinimonas TaxID=240411 RepID=A0A1K2HRS4_9NEIS|nr:flagellar protein FliO/FliZ [Chitinimonas taiwanensis DSM 18899]